MAAPLLDWTESPFIALYFAAISARDEASASYSVWAISRAMIEEVNAKIHASETDTTKADRLPVVELVTPLSDENSRLVNQRGLFTHGPNNIDLEARVKRYTEADSRLMTLIKLSVPRTGLDECLRYLNRMNINHATLFPDLLGASQFCNLGLSINGY